MLLEHLFCCQSGCWDVGHVVMLFTSMEMYENVLRERKTHSATFLKTCICIGMDILYSGLFQVYSASISTVVSFWVDTLSESHCE